MVYTSWQGVYDFIAYNINFRFQQRHGLLQTHMHNI